MAWFQQQQQFTVQASGTATFSLSATRVPLDRLTIWASSGGRVVSLSFQPKLNGKNRGAATTVAAAAAADPIYSSGGAAAGTDNLLMPVSKPGVDRLDLEVLITNNDGANPARVTIYAVGIEHVG